MREEVSAYARFWLGLLLLEISNSLVILAAFHRGSCWDEKSDAWIHVLLWAGGPKGSSLPFLHPCSSRWQRCSPASETVGAQRPSP